MLNIKPLKFILVFGVFILFIILPSLNHADYEQSTNITKFIFFVISCLVLFGVYILVFLLSKQKNTLISKLDIAIILFVLFITIDRYFIQEKYGFSIRYIELLGLVTLYIILRILSFKNFIWILLTIIVSGIIQSVYGILQLLGHFPSNHSNFNITGSFSNPGPYSGFLITVWAVALGMYLFKDYTIRIVNASNRNKNQFLNILTKYLCEYVPLIGIMSIILVVPATHSRAAWVSLLICSLTVYTFKYYTLIKERLKKIDSKKKTGLIILVISLFFTGLFSLYHFKKGSADGRLFIWEVTSEIIKDYPLSGVGFDMFRTYYMNYQADYFLRNGETPEVLVADNTYYAFNEYLQYLSENGIIGVVIFSLLIYTILTISIINGHKYLYRLAISVFIATGIFALFSYPAQVLPIKLILVFMLAVLGRLDTNKFIVYRFNKMNRPYVSQLLKIAFVAFTGVILVKSYVNIQTLNSSFKTWKKALSLYKYGDYEEALMKYERVYPILKRDGDFLMNYGKTLSLVNRNKEAIKILEEAKQYLNTTVIETALGDAYKGIKDYKKAEIAYQHAANMIPIRFYPLYLQAKLYEETGEREKAITIAKTILNKDIKVPSTAIKEMKIEMRKILNKQE